MTLHANWFLWVFPLAAVLACSFARPVWLRWSCLIALILSIIGISIPYFQAYDTGPHVHWKNNPLRQTMGWDHLTNFLTEVHYDPKTNFLVSDTYQTASLLSFYSPGQKRAYFINLYNHRRNQFCYWPQVTTEGPHTGFFVTILDNTSEINALVQVSEAYEARLRPYFTTVELLGVGPLFAANDRVVRVALVFAVGPPTGEMPPCASHY
jgi:hypothetical protein